MRKHNRGFTLIEILVVLVVIGIFVAFALPQLGTLGTDQSLNKEASKLAALMELASDEATMQGREFGLRFGESNYIFYDLDADTGAWVELTDDDYLRERNLPEGFRFRLWIEEREIVLGQSARPPATEEPDSGETVVGPPPHIALLSSGESTPFELLLEQDFVDQQIILTGDALSAIAIEANRQ